jgi:predicted MPP superfamily phosphohydrolase
LIHTVANFGIEFYFTGHTHGGQVRLPFWGAPFFFKQAYKTYEAGEFREKNTIMYVNRGIGFAQKLNLNIRFLARPEVSIFWI